MVSRRALVTIIVVLSILLGGVCLFFLFDRMDRSRVVRVIDGDTFVLRDGERIRLLGVDAPEDQSCFSKPATAYLSGLVLNKRVSLRDTMRDGYGRLLADVFVDNHFVNENMVGNGGARNTRSNTVYAQLLSETEQTAKDHQLGVWSPECRQISSGTACLIKGNTRNAAKTYHLPVCPNYNDTIVDLSFGDRWFCSEEEASQAGFLKASGCPE